MSSQTNLLISALQSLGKEAHHTEIAEKARRLKPDVKGLQNTFQLLYTHSKRARNPVVKFVGNGAFKLTSNSFKQPLQTGVKQITYFTG